MRRRTATHGRRAGSAAGVTRGGVLALAFALVLPGALEAQAGRARVEEGNRLYRDGRFEEAHQKYLEAMAEAPGSPIIPFNDGNALYQSADYARAMEAYQRALESGDPALAGAAWYNLGNALYRQQQLQPALEAYKEALRLNPADADAKHNLERVLDQMQQQQQQQPQEGDPDEESEEGEPSEQDPSQSPAPRNAGDEAGEEEQDAPEAGAQGEDEELDQPSEGEQPGDDEAPPQGAARGEPRADPDRLTEEEAERLLDAIDEDPEDVNRRPASARGRLPRKPW